MVDKEFYHDEEKWRSRVKPFIVQPGERRVPLVREAVKEQLAETYDGEEHVEEYIRVNVHRYVSWRRMRERCDVEIAERDFWAQLELAESDGEDSQGEPVIWVKDCVRKRVYRGKRQSAMSTHQRAGSPGSDMMAERIPHSARKGRQTTKESDEDGDLGAGQAIKRRRMYVKGPNISVGETSEDGGMEFDALSNRNMVASVMGGATLA